MTRSTTNYTVTLSGEAYAELDDDGNVVCDYAADGKLIGVEVIGPDESNVEE